MKNILVSTFIMFMSCRGERWDDKLSIPFRSFDGNQLKTDGYYFRESEGRYDILFLYRDGTTLYGGAPLVSEIESMEHSYSNGEYYEIIKNIKHDWGRFVVDGNSFTREFWQPSSGGPLDAYTHTGTILNDTTLHITQAWMSCKTKKKNDLDRVYHFKKFSSKPDSTNSYTN